MPTNSKKFPHIPLELTTTGTAAPIRGGSRKKNPITAANFGNRTGHGGKLKSSVYSIIAYWEQEENDRERENKPSLPPARRLILQIDPNSFDAESLKGFGIEVIAELEDGYIIGASSDLELSKLQQKIDKFISEEYGGNKVAEIWDIIEGYKKIDYILSPELLENWDKIKDNQLEIVDVGISCLGTKSQLPDYPIQKDNESNERYSKRVNDWINKRNMTYEEWDNLKFIREEELENFLQDCQGKILSILDGDIPNSAILPDSFTCRIQISGRGLKYLVFNFPYLFDVSRPDEILEFIENQNIIDKNETPFHLESPPENAPQVCVIDSGIQEGHRLLRNAIRYTDSFSWVPQDDMTADLVEGGGHGTRVAGAILYPRSIPRQGTNQAVCWIQNARILNDQKELPDTLFPPNILDEIIEFYHKQKGTKLFNHSITGIVPCRTGYMSAWASAIDQLTWQNDILFIVASGNLPSINTSQFQNHITRLSVKEHLQRERAYPHYLLESSCRIANPAQSLQSLTVGSIALTSYSNFPFKSIAEQNQPSAFSCTGFGIWNTIKPEVVEYGGDFVINENNKTDLATHSEVCPELVRSTLGGSSPAFARDSVGTSFATPKVTHIAACLQAEFPKESCLLYRALIVQSARWPEWTESSDLNKRDILRMIGYGIPNLDRAIENTQNRITLITQGERTIQAKYAHVYQVKLPDDLRSQGEDIDILLEVTLSYKAQPRRTRRNHRKYLSTWLDWDCSKRGEEPDRFLNRVLKEYDALENTEEGEGLFKWTLGKQKNYGLIKDVSRTLGTLQKDWTKVKSYELREAFCIAVVGHEGWNNDPDASVPYTLVVSFEALNVDIPIYTTISQAQTQIEVTETVRLRAGQ
ncbi:S8 family peptidase [Pannus brasiliensis CCIBt3594]|uniref:S8 family peptidase n=1 Tax=Pannus brasiliensis CCIBt3594 TaxID=1427578 RepID=A0AAW9QT04_9CHRO